MDCLSICKLLQRLLEEDLFWNWAAAAIAIVKSTHGGLNDGVQFASFFSSVFVLGFLLGIYPRYLSIVSQRLDMRQAGPL